ncbi:hypothetical protein M426DRAFT_323464 [Hypoxylon sp. CI-4A]|nr:hypothetical protein M426DRAFT_323464 [Hypoxylon sp. CI-4A]
MALPFPIPSCLPPEFSISRCTTADVDTLSEVYYDAFQSDKRNTFWWPSDKKPMLTWIKSRVRRKLGDQTVRHFKITDVQSSDTVAFARWDIPQGHEAAFGEWVGDEEAKADAARVAEAAEHAEDALRGEDVTPTTAPVEAITPPAADIPEGASPELCQVFFDALKEMSEKYNAKEMLGLSLLCTSAKYHRRGAAKALMLPMLALADAEGLKTYLEATPGGKPVYEKLGFREMEELPFDLEKLIKGFNGAPYKLSIMVREPNSI